VKIVDAWRILRVAGTGRAIISYDNSKLDK